MGCNPVHTKQESFLPELEIHKSEHGFTPADIAVDLIPNRGNFDFSSRSPFESVGKIRKNCAALPET
jgi:hypothetical protein